MFKRKDALNLQDYILCYDSNFICTGNFQPLEAVSRGSETQLEVGDHFNSF